MSQAAAKAEQAIGHGDNAITAQDITNYSQHPQFADDSETMKALAWMGKNTVEMSEQPSATRPTYSQHRHRY